MTATDEKTPESGDTVASTGRVARVIGPVVDVEFPADQMPEIYFALHVDVTVDADTTRTLTLEVEQHIGSQHAKFNVFARLRRQRCQLIEQLLQRRFVQTYRAFQQNGQDSSPRVR